LSIISIHVDNSINNLKQNIKKRVSTLNLYNKQNGFTTKINQNRGVVTDLNCTRKKLIMILLYSLKSILLLNNNLIVVFSSWFF